MSDRSGAPGPPRRPCARLPDLAALFGTNKTTSGCYCLWFLVSAKECQAGWGGGNRVAFEAATAAGATPMGLLAYRDGEPVGWCAAGPAPGSPGRCGPGDGRARPGRGRHGLAGAVLLRPARRPPPG